MINNRYKEDAIKFRRNGYSYSDILKKIPVSKSTLSVWFNNIDLTDLQKKVINEKRLKGSLKGALKRKQARLEIVKNINSKARLEVGIISSRELFLIGVMLYWAEGSKEKSYKIGSGVRFSNSDPLMIDLFLRWLREICHIGLERLVFELYIHRNSDQNINDAIDYWSKELKIPHSYFKHVYFKKHNINPKRKKIKDLYYGQIRVNVKASSELNRFIAGWIQAVVQNSVLK